LTTTVENTLKLLHPELRNPIFEGFMKTVVQQEESRKMLMPSYQNPGVPAAQKSKSLTSAEKSLTYTTGLWEATTASIYSLLNSVCITTGADLSTTMQFLDTMPLHEARFHDTLAEQIKLSKEMKKLNLEIMTLKVQVAFWTSQKIAEDRKKSDDKATKAIAMM
jgi:hypothetical protein